MAKKSPDLPLLPFKRFFTYEEMTEILRRLVAARPGLARLESLGRSREGREIWRLVVTDFATGNPEDKPAYAIHGNIHAAELSGTHAALYTARQLLADYPRRTRLLEHVAFHVIPRLNPDGAEVMATTSGALRSRTDRARLAPNTLVQEDMDDNGVIVTMRIRRPDGDFVADPKDTRLMIRRKADSKGPFYRLLPEGRIHEWDGTDNIAVEGRSIDWNRQWSYEWRPEPEQAGAGDFPYSEPEMRHMAEFVSAHPNLFGVLGYHTGPAAFLRPPSIGTDADLDAQDLRTMEELGEVAHRHTGLPAVPVYRYGRRNARNSVLHGHFPSTGYQHWGLFVFEFELGTIMDSAGMGFNTVMSWTSDEEYQEGMRRVMRWWDKRGRTPRFFLPWRRHVHPQLGPVEIGGRVAGVWAGMVMADLKRLCEGTYQFTRHHAERHPRVVIEDVETRTVGEGIWRVRARVANRGTFPTHVTQRGAKLKRLQGVRAEFHLPGGAELLSQRGHGDLGHLEGVTGVRALEWFLRAPEGARCRIDIRGGAGGNVSKEVPLATFPA